jgi:serine/threonine protein kinase
MLAFRRAIAASRRALLTSSRVPEIAQSACIGCGRPRGVDRCSFCGIAFAPGGFQTLRVIAQGPHGRVYAARAPGGEQVALKELQFASVPGATQIDAFEREAATLKTLRHPAIPRFVASFSDGEGVALRLYMASQFIEGEALSARIAGGRLGEDELRDVARQVLRVLVYLHGQPSPVLHRDIKPDNVLVRPDGALVLVDFGSARRLSGPETYNATIAGTFGYMPAEQLGGTVDRTSDLYALGATLLHAATGKQPADLLTKDFTLLVPDSVPPALRPFLARLLQPRRERRFRSATEALAAIDRAPAPQVRPVFVAAMVACLAIAIGSSARSARRPRTASAPAAARPATLPQEVAAGWFQRAKPSCNAVEVAQSMARFPPPAGWKGAGYGAGCWALAGKIADARALIEGLGPDERRRAAGIVFDLAHPVADAGDDVSAAPIMNLVLESLPDHYMALYHAGMSDYALGNVDRARTHLADFLRNYSIEDGFRRNAQQVLARLE